MNKKRNKVPNMLKLILTALAAAALAAPQYGYEAPRGSIRGGGDSSEEAAILRDDRDRDDSGRYSVAVETENGIRLTDSGAPGAKGAIAASGSFSYTAPDGTPVSLQYVADENGFQPQSDLLPVAPAFPHPIPQFVLDQIAFAAEEDRRGKSVSSPSGSYSAPRF
ncbi:cuticle protein AM/CP1114-like [Macrobrachium nipponense]|uniref:cuticle protein AM/CP1114-like n=1 Tax=Macrobrachium nipponense TaxID=159736 RepID=UPI0030C89011